MNALWKRQHPILIFDEGLMNFIVSSDAASVATFSAIFSTIFFIQIHFFPTNIRSGEEIEHASSHEKQTSEREEIFEVAMGKKASFVSFYMLHLIHYLSALIAFSTVNLLIKRWKFARVSGRVGWLNYFYPFFKLQPNLLNSHFSFLLGRNSFKQTFLPANYPPSLSWSLFHPLRT